MKTNPKHHWKITLIGRGRAARSRCQGDIEDALHAADVAESNVPWVVRTYVIDRGPKVRARRKTLTTKHK